MPTIFREMYKNVHSRFVCHSKDMETTNMSLTGEEINYTAMKMCTSMENTNDSKITSSAKNNCLKVEHDATLGMSKTRNFRHSYMVFKL